MNEERLSQQDPATMTEPLGTLPAAKKAYNRMGLALFVMMLTTSLVQMLLGALAGLLMNSGWDPSQSVWFSWVATFGPLYGVGIPLALLLMRSVPAQPAEPVKLGGRFWLYLLMCFPMLYAGNILGMLLSSALTSGQAANPLETFAFSTSPLKLLFLVILAPLLEEFIFRKQILDRCAVYGEKLALLFSALVFALAHGNLFQFFYAFGLGLLFGYVYLRTKQLRYSVIMHVTVNFIGSALAPFLLSQLDLEALLQIDQLTPEQMIAMLPGVTTFLVYVVALLGLSLAGLIVLLVRWSRATFLPADQQVPRGMGFQAVYANLWVIVLILFCMGFFVLHLV